MILKKWYYSLFLFLSFFSFLSFSIHKTTLSLAAEKNCTKIVKFLISKGDWKKSRENELNSEIDAALRKAIARSCSLELIKCLISKQTRFDAVENSIEMGKFDIFKQWVEMKGNDFEGSSSLWVSCSFDRLDFVKYLVEEKMVSVNSTNKTQESCLTISITKNRLEIMKYLVDKGANINQPNRFDQTPLYSAAWCQKFEMVKILIDKGARLDLCSKKGETPLCIASSVGDLEIVKCLIENGADFNFETKNGESPLWLAAAHNRFEVLKYLVSSEKTKGKINLNQCDDHGNSVLLSCCYSPNLEIVQLLVQQKGINLNLQDTAKQTAIFLACSSGHFDLVKCLAEAGADLTLENINGNTLFWIACLHDRFEIIEYLGNNHLTIEQMKKPNPNGETPFSKASSQKVIKYLNSKGIFK